MDIHSLMIEFAKLGESQIGRGPKHPTHPNPDLAPEIEAFLDEYNFLRKDEGYVAFLECYAGAGLYNEQPEFSIDLFGFNESLATHLVRGEGLIIDEDGFLGFADGLFGNDDQRKNSSELMLGAAFDATGKRKWGVYRGHEHGDEMYWYCETFLEWLDAIIRFQGNLPQHLPAKGD